MNDQPLVDTFIAGFVGEPGHRTFYLQVDDAGSRSWYLLEKGQVAALAVEAGRLLSEHGLAGAGEDLEVGDLAEPNEVEFRVGDLELRYREGAVDLVLVAVGEVGAPVVHRMSAAQLDAAARVAATAVTAGRPPCPRCGLAMDPEGHSCPLTNGDLRGYRP